jgi:hypothetical protein
VLEMVHCVKERERGIKKEIYGAGERERAK